MYNGIINIYKEAGYTSHDVVAKMRGICKQKKIGHTGTLDPDAVGVLPVCLGSGTKLCDMLTDKEKEYITELLLGVTTDTQDTSGQVLTRREVLVTEQEVIQAIQSFQGVYKQIPPMYSALKVNGKRLYELAREGKEVERKARLVSIPNIEILEIKLPVIRMKVTCSKGTYIRTLCADIGEKLGCGATMTYLERTRVGNFTAEQAITLSQLEELRDKGRIIEKIYPVDSVFENCPVLHILEEHQKLINNGNSFFPNQTIEQRSYLTGQWVRVYSEEEKFYGIYTYEQNKHYYKPVKMFLEQN